MLKLLGVDTIFDVTDFIYLIFLIGFRDLSEIPNALQICIWNSSGGNAILIYIEVMVVVILRWDLINFLIVSHK